MGNRDGRAARQGGRQRGTFAATPRRTRGTLTGKKGRAASREKGRAVALHSTEYSGTITTQPHRLAAHPSGTPQRRNEHDGITQGATKTRGVIPFFLFFKGGFMAGRKPLPLARAKSEGAKVRLTPGQYARLLRLAAFRELTVSELIRSLIDGATVGIALPEELHTQNRDMSRA